MGNSDHGTTCMRVGGDDGELRPWHYTRIRWLRVGVWGLGVQTAQLASVKGVSLLPHPSATNLVEGLGFRDLGLGF